MKHMQAFNGRKNQSLRLIILLAFLSIFLVSCSSTKKPAPITDKSSNVAKKPVKKDAKSDVKSQPVKEEKATSKVNSKTNDTSDSKVDTSKSDKPAEARVDSTVDSELKLLKPANGEVLSSYNGSTNKGVDIAGKMGDAVLSAADGKVIFSDAFKGYGNTLIIKHNSNYVTVYAHNKNLLVKEGQTVKRGQKIAEMGSTESDRVKLHFEVRRDGKPVDPARYLQ